MGSSPRGYLFWGIIEPEEGAWWRDDAERDDDLEEKVATELGVELVTLGYGDGGAVYGLALVETVWRSEWGGDVRPCDAPGQPRALYSWNAYRGLKEISLVPAGTIPTPEWDARLDQAIQQLGLNLSAGDYYEATAARGWILSSYYG